MTWSLFVRGSTAQAVPGMLASAFSVAAPFCSSDQLFSTSRTSAPADSGLDDHVVVVAVDLKAVDDVDDELLLARIVVRACERVTEQLLRAGRRGPRRHSRRASWGPRPSHPSATPCVGQDEGCRAERRHAACGYERLTLGGSFVTQLLTSWGRGPCRRPAGELGAPGCQLVRMAPAGCSTLRKKIPIFHFAKSATPPVRTPCHDFPPAPSRAGSVTTAPHSRNDTFSDRPVAVRPPPTAGKPASANLHTECPAGSRPTGVLHRGDACAAPFRRTVPFAFRLTTNRV